MTFTLDEFNKITEDMEKEVYHLHTYTSVWLSIDRYKPKINIEFDLDGKVRVMYTIHNNNEWDNPMYDADKIREYIVLIVLTE